MKAAQSSLHLKGKSGVLTTHSQACFPTPQLLKLGNRVKSSQKAIGKCFVGPQLLKSILVVVCLFVRLGH